MSSSESDSETGGQYSRKPDIKFALTTWKTLLKTNLQLLFSPYSLYRGLAVLAVEVLPRFREAFLSTLCFRDASLSIDDFAAAVRKVAAQLESTDQFILRDVTQLWINEAFNISESRFNASQQQFSLNVSTVMFPHPAIETINAHVRGATDGMIPAALSPDSIDGDLAFLITNPLYLHGQWVTKFDSAATRMEPFTRFDGSTVETEIMRAELKAPYSVNNLAQLVFLPYAQSSCEFVAILPSNNSEAGVRRALTAIDPSWLDSDRHGDAIVHLRLPKFRAMGPTLSLNELARELGLKEVFETQEPIFPQTEGEPRLAMGEIKQQVVIEVDEVGTSIEHVTYLGGAARGLPPPVVHVNFDRPFAFVIRDQVTGTILLMGTYLDPTGHSTSG
jgi:serpin B